jgi:hypothetical protein
VHHVGGVEELCDGRVDEFLSLLQGVRFLGFLGLVREVECLSGAGVGAVVVDIRVLAFPVLLSEDLKKSQTGSRKRLMVRTLLPQVVVVLR